MRSLLLSTLFFVYSSMAFGFHSSFGGIQHRNAVQDSSGSKTAASISPNLSIGHNFNLLEGWMMSPQLGYIYHILGSEDSYGEYKSHTLYVLFDFLYDPGWDPSFRFRYGIGNFMRSISGDGGTVTVPNGGGTDTAYRPGSTSTSYSTSLDLGMDYYFFDPLMGPSIDSTVDWGARFSVFLFEIIDPDKATWSYQIAITGYF